MALNDPFLRSPNELTLTNDDWKRIQVKHNRDQFPSAKSAKSVDSIPRRFAVKSESDKILSMLEEGSITAEEAEELLAAVEDSPPPPAGIESSDPPPDMDAIRSAWRIPFNISLILMAISGSLLFRTRKAAGLAGLLRRLFFWPVTILSGLVAILVYFSKDGPWLHVRVREDDGSRFAISLPFPLHLIRGGLRIAQSQVPDPEVREKLDVAAEFLEAVETSDLQDPLTVDVRENGESVQVYIG